MLSSVIALSWGLFSLSFSDVFTVYFEVLKVHGYRSAAASH